jgi:hypothetical protein
MTEADIIFCWRTHQDVRGFVYLGDTRNGFGMLIDTGRYAGDDGWTPLKQRRASLDSSSSTSKSGSKKKKSTALEVNWTDYLHQHRANARETLLLAGMLGVHPDALRRLELGYVPETEQEPEHWLFPERDGAGDVIGLLRRYANKKKKRMTGSRSGLLFDPTEPMTDILLIVEGASDVAAAFTMGLCAVGRPNNIGGSEMLAPLIREKVTDGVPVVVLGENDRKTNGLWPGRDGTLHIAEHLSRLLRQRIAWAMPLEGIKDLREWLWEAKPDVLNGEQCRTIGQKILDIVRANLQWMEPPGSRGMCLNDEEEQSNSDIDSRSNSANRIHIHTTIVRTTPASQEQSNSDKPSCPSSFPSFSDFSQWELLGPATQEVLSRGKILRPCPKHYVPLLQGRNNARIGLALRVDCRMYSCPVCGLRRRCRWLLHFLAIFELQTALYAAHVSVERLDAITKHIRRHEADYLAISQADGQVLFIASCEFPEGRQVSALEAAELVATALQSIDTKKRRAVNTSRAWSLCENHPQADYIRRGAAPTGRFRLVVQRLHHSQLAPSVSPTDHGARADWPFPGDWPDERIDWFYEGLSSPPRVEEEEDGQDQDT